MDGSLFGVAASLRGKKKKEFYAAASHGAPAATTRRRATRVPRPTMTICGAVRPSEPSLLLLQGSSIQNHLKAAPLVHGNHSVLH
jgi:hypothetical protein